MYLKIKHISLLIILALAVNLHAQQSFTLKQALELAAKNNVERKNSQLKIEESKMQVKEIWGAGLPHVNFEGTFGDQIQLPVFLFPNPQTGKNEAVRVGNQYNASYNISASQLLFDGSFFLGVKTAKSFVELYNRMDKQTETEVKYNTAKAYFLCLMTHQNIKLMEENIDLIKKNIHDAEVLYSNGFIEQINIDRLEVVLSELLLQRNKLNDAKTITLKLLNLQMGMDVNTEINLLDNIGKLYKSYGIPSSLNIETAVKTRPDIKVYEQKIMLDSANIKRYKVTKYPKLYAAFNYQKQSFNNEEIKFPTWYPSSMLGLSLKIPIFDGFSNKNKIAQTKIQLQADQNTYANFLNSVKLETITAELKYKRNLENLGITEKVKKLNKKILYQTNIKHKEGVASSLEITTANKDYQNSSITHLNAMYELLLSSVELRKVFGLEILPE